MLQRLKRHAPWVAGWLAATLIGTFLLARSDLVKKREVFEADARIVHRLLSQRVAQHDAVLSTLAVLRPANEQARPEQRLPSVYPQIVSVQHRDADGVWSDPQLLAAEDESRRLRRAVLADVNFAKGRYQVVTGADPVSHALLIDLRTLVPWNEWPMPRETSPVRMTLEYAGQSFLLQPGITGDDDTSGWRFVFQRPLAAESQPFEVVAERQVGWGELPWSLMLSWALVVAVMLLAARALLRQRTDRHRTEQLLRLGQVARLNTLGELAAGIAQELDQPLTEMLASTRAADQVLGEDPPDLATAKLAVQQAMDQAQRAFDVVHRLRRAVQQPDMGSQIRDIDLHQVARKALHLLEPELRRRGVTPGVELVGPAFMVKAEPVALDQIVHNLLLNALQALDQVQVSDRSLVLSLNATDGYGQLSLRDTGPGIRPEVLAHVFEPFFTTREGGLGLGLSLCKSLALGMGGTLAAFNRAPRGAEFCLGLPLASLR